MLCVWPAAAASQHYDAYSLENFNNQAAPAAPPPVCAGPDCDRTHFNAIVPEQELAETYLPAFTRGCVQVAAAEMHLLLLLLLFLLFTDNGLSPPVRMR